MEGVAINSGFVDLAKTDFKCPNCGKEYSDADDKYLKRMNKNKSGATHFNCEDCCSTIHLTYSIMGDIVSFLKQK